LLFASSVISAFRWRHEFEISEIQVLMEPHKFEGSKAIHLSFAFDLDSRSFALIRG